jgi:hypothetical protein
MESRHGTSTVVGATSEANEREVGEGSQGARDATGRCQSIGSAVVEPPGVASAHLTTQHATMRNSQEMILAHSFLRAIGTSGLITDRACGYALVAAR